MCWLSDRLVDDQPFLGLSDAGSSLQQACEAFNEPGYVISASGLRIQGHGTTRAEKYGELKLVSKRTLITCSVSVKDSHSVKFELNNSTVQQIQLQLIETMQFPFGIPYKTLRYSPDS